MAFLRWCRCQTDRNSLTKNVVIRSRYAGTQNLREDGEKSASSRKCDGGQKTTDNFISKLKFNAKALSIGHVITMDDLLLCFEDTDKERDVGSVIGAKITTPMAKKQALTWQNLNEKAKNSCWHKLNGGDIQCNIVPASAATSRFLRSIRLSTQLCVK